MTKLLNAYISKSISKVARKFALATTLICTVFAMSNATHAANTTIPVDLAGINTTKHEIALLQVLSEICPPMLNKSQRVNFFKAYNSELRKQLPTIKDPDAAIQYLSTQQDYKGVLTSMRSWTMGYAKEDNQALCVELATKP